MRDDYIRIAEFAQNHRCEQKSDLFKVQRRFIIFRKLDNDLDSLYTMLNKKYMKVFPMKKINRVRDVLTLVLL